MTLGRYIGAIVSQEGSNRDEQARIALTNSCASDEVKTRAKRHKRQSQNENEITACDCPFNHHVCMRVTDIDGRTSMEA